MDKFKLKTDAPLSRRIVRSFLHFLNSVEPAPGVDLEGLDVAKECLMEVFKLELNPHESESKPDSLIDLFTSLDASGPGATAVNAPSSSTAPNVANPISDEAPKSMDEDHRGESHSSGVSGDELFGQFISALEKIHYFKTMPDGIDDTTLVDNASSSFHDALCEMEKSGSQGYNTKNLAETFKNQGNRAMQSKLYSNAIDLYSFAIALSENNAVYFCNRAAAYTQIQKYSEALSDCLKSIEIDPNYVKAYSRLGLVYYAQGNYSDAIEKGFKRALQLDPNNEFVKENIQMVEQKLREEQQRRSGQDQSSGSTWNNPDSNSSTAGSRSHTTPPTFSMPFNSGALPADLASMLMHMATNMPQGQASQNRQGEGGNMSGSDEPGIQLDGNINLSFGEQMPGNISMSFGEQMPGNINMSFGEEMPQNINLNLGDQMPEDLSGALRSVMEMLSGASSQANSQNGDTRNGR